MKAKTLTMDKNEVRLFFPIYNISKKHFISLLLEEKVFDFHVHKATILAEQLNSGNWKQETE